MNIKLSIALLFIVFISSAQPQVLDRVVAIVGKNPLLLSEIETTIVQQKDKKELGENARCKVFEDLLFQKLLLAQADRDSITATDAEVENMLLDSIKHAKDDIAIRALTEARTEGEQLLKTTEKFLQKNADHLHSNSG